MTDDLVTRLDTIRQDLLVELVRERVNHDRARVLLDEAIETICGEFCGTDRHHAICRYFRDRREAMRKLP